jgi:hypothetical protein
MIPMSNTRHVVCDQALSRIDDLIVALREAGLLPKRVPAIGYGHVEYEIPRFDARFVFRYALDLGAPRLEIYPADDGGRVFRAALAVPLVDTHVDLFSSAALLASFNFKMAGRVAIHGEIEVIDGAAKALLFRFREFEFHFDDSSRNVPLPLPRTDIERLISRAANREIRLKLNATPPKAYLPASPAIDFPSVPYSLGFAPRELTLRDDWFSQRVCLVADASCNPGPMQQRSFYDYLDLYAGLRPPTDPSPIAPVGDGLRRHFQVDIGSQVLAVILQGLNAHPDLHGDKTFIGIFRVKWQLQLSLDRWPTGVDQAAIKVHGQVEAFMAYPKIKWCEKKVFGVKVKYPCGITKEWAKLKTLSARVKVRPQISGTSLCVERTDFDIDQDTTILGYIVQFLIGSILSLFLPGGGVAWGIIFNIVIEMLDEILEKVANNALPNEFCKDIKKYLTVPIVANAVDLTVTRPALEFRTTGLSLAADGDFREIV